MAHLTDTEVTRLHLDARAARLHRQSVVVDLHVDALLTHRLFGVDLTKEHSASGLWRGRSIPFDLARALMQALGYHRPFYNHADLPRLQRGGYGLVGFGLHAWPRQSEGSYREVLRQIDAFDTLADRDEGLVRARTPDDVQGAFDTRRLAAFVGLEGAHGLGAGGKRNETRRLDRVETLYERGVRYITLAHFSRNDAVAPCFGPAAPRPGDDPGLSEFGRALVRKMNEVSMLVDVAHVSPLGVLQACEISDKPVIATHTGLAGVDRGREDGARRRNISDEALIAIAETGGVVGIIFAPQFLTGAPDGLGAVVRHLRHGIDTLNAAGLSGADHMAIGSDLDGWINTIPNEMNDAADMPLLTQTLCNADFSDNEIRGIWGEAFLRAWGVALEARNAR